MNPIIIVAETGSDITPELAAKYNITLVPMHVTFDSHTMDVSNAVCLGSRILHIHPCIEIQDGKLVATKKYRGKMKKIARQLILDYIEDYNLDRSILWFVRTVGLSDDIRIIAEETAKECGFQKIQWLQANGVITTHGGPAAFGLAGFTE